MIRSSQRPARFWAINIALWFWLALPMVHAISDEGSNAAELMLASVDGSLSAALLLETHIEGEINGLIAKLTLRQTFRNTSTQWVNGRYVFPMPEKSAVESLTLETGGRLIRGVVKEKQQAKKEFAAAKASGKKAGLMEQNRPNLFSMSLANIAPLGEVIAEITWVETVEFDAGMFALRLPTTLTPRYIPGRPLVTDVNSEDYMLEQKIVIDGSSGWAQNTDQVMDAALITPFQIGDSGAAANHRFTIDLGLSAGIPLAGITSATHGIEVTQIGQDGLANPRQRIRFLNVSEPMDRDLVISWTPAASSTPDAAVFTQHHAEGNHTLLMLMPPQKNIVQTVPREIIFIIDSSGSMAGVSMPQARQGLKTALGYLSPVDRFNIVDFDNSAKALFGLPMQATQSHLARADQFVTNLVADGGTNMEAALSLAFSMPIAKNYLRQIVFITDGSVGNESNLFRLINKRLGEARLFTMGIGSAPNSHFMRGAAHYGRGSYHFTDSLDQAAVRMNELFTKINRPVMRDIQIHWPENSDVEFYPSRIPDLYLGEPIMILAKTSSPPGEIEISGKLSGSSWKRVIRADGAPIGSGLDKIWARRKVDSLESRQVIAGKPLGHIKQQIVDLGVAHQLVTRFTSFIAVEEKLSRTSGQSVANATVPNLMPKGNTMMLPLPNTATPASLLILLGLMVMLFAAAVGCWFSSRRVFKLVWH